MALNNSHLIPFGKHKGKPVEVLQEDENYREWLVAQPWFRERFANLYTVIINNFGEPAETPEHNSLQAIFLDEAVRWKIARLFFPPGFFDLPTFDEISSTWMNAIGELIEQGQKLADWELIVRNNVLIIQNRPFKGLTLRTTDTFVISEAEMEEHGIDVSFDVRVNPILDQWTSSFSSRFLELPGPMTSEGIWCFQVEIKPIVADDYPAILRQIKSRKRPEDGKAVNILFLREYQGVGATKDQFGRMFYNSGIEVIYETDLSNVAGAAPSIDCNKAMLEELKKNTAMLIASKSTA